MAKDEEKLTVYFDGACPLCQREIGFISNQVSSDTVTFLDVSTDAQQDLGDNLDQNKAMKRFHVRRADGTLLSGAAAFAEIWKKTVWMKPIGYLVGAPGLTRFFDWLYDRFLLIRPRLQRFVTKRVADA